MNNQLDMYRRRLAAVHDAINALVAEGAELGDEQLEELLDDELDLIDEIYYLEHPGIFVLWDFLKTKHPTHAQYEHAFTIIQRPCWEGSDLAAKVDKRIVRYLEETKAYMAHILDELVAAPFPIPPLRREYDALSNVGKLLEHPAW